MRYACLLFLVAASLWGQAIFDPMIRFPEQIRTYLALTQEQVMKIGQQNNAFARWSQERTQRMFQVQFEISEETAKSPLDPGALGVRYAEVEAIRREIAEREQTVLTENVAVLTAAQKVKLEALKEALKLVPTGSAAESVRLLPCQQPVAYLASVAILPVSVIRQPFPGYNPSSSCVPQTWINTPDFLPQP